MKKYRKSRKGKIVYHIHPDLWRDVELTAIQARQEPFVFIRAAIAAHIKNTKAATRLRKAEHDKQRKEAWLERERIGVESVTTKPAPTPKPTTVEE